MSKVLRVGSTPGLLEEVDISVAASSNWFTSEYRLSEGRIIPSGCFIHSPVTFETNGNLLEIENTGILAVEYVEDEQILLDAPVDGKIYGRYNGNWSEVSAINHTHDTLYSSITHEHSNYLEDAPSDGSEYVRKDGTWVVKGSDTSWKQLELASDIFTTGCISLFEVPVNSGQRLYFKFIGVIGEFGGSTAVSFSHTGSSGSIYMMYNNVNYEYMGDPLTFNIEEAKDIVIAEGCCLSSSTGNFRIGLNVISGSATVEKGCDLMYKVL